MHRPLSNWMPTASIHTLKMRAAFTKRIREYFENEQVLEVETPILSEFTGTDVHLSQWRTDSGYALHTSPEFAMKRLLAAGSGDIYQLCKVFRRDESGRRHNAEFTMLEWYRLEFDEFLLMQDVVALIEFVTQQPAPTVTTLTFADAFELYGLPNPHTASLGSLRFAAEEHLHADAHSWSLDDCLDALMSGVVEPNLNPNVLTFIHNYPQSQAALAQTTEVDDHVVARRFELYWRSMELANGYFELTDAQEQRLRMEAEARKRLDLGLPEPDIDKRFLQALQAGLPPCSGVALGLDRLLMILLEANHINDVISFPITRA